MWLQPLTHWLLVVTLASQVGRGPAPAPPPLPQLVPMRQALFAIPYQLDRTEDTTRQPVEVQLFVSVDRGAHWQFYAKAPTTQPNFPFRAGGDGEFWFAIRTVDRSGQARPATISGPGLRVLVDTKPPVVRLSSQLRADGQASIHIEIDETTPKPGGLSIVYRPSPTEPWQAVRIDPQAISSSAGHQTGEIAFWPKLGSSDMVVRADVTDLAGNSATAQAKVLPVQSNGQRQQSPQAGNLSSPYGGKAEGNTGNAFQPSADGKPNAAGGGLAASFNKPAGNLGTGQSAEPRGSVAIAINPPIGSRYSGNGGPALSKASVGVLPPGERPRWVNSRLFELEYDVDSVGPSGIGRVELWGTQDGGKSWRKFPLGNSRRSPLLVNVDEEGIYGFRIVVTNGAGLGGKPPRGGDLPDLWIGVDLTKPTARLVGAQQGADAETGHLIITWQADDRMLAPRPVSLSFSETRAGPWLPVASGLENSGRYAWSIDNRLPAKIYLRLEVRDEAGNVAVHELADPVLIDQSRPTIRIRDVRPLGDSGSRSTLWR
ncbi:MAG: hypothetical protein ABFC96_02220 [Thermoguttaceae bacterium]